MEDHYWLPLEFPFWRAFNICSIKLSILSILLSSACWLAIIVCWLARVRSIWTSTAFGRTSIVESSSEGRFSMCPTKDFADSEPTLVTILSNLRPVVNSRRVLAVDGVARLSWDAMAMAGCRIGVEIRAALDVGTTSAWVYVTRVWVFSVLVLSDAAASVTVSILLSIVLSGLAGTTCKFWDLVAACPARA